MAWQDHRRGSELAQGHCSGSLVMQGQGLCLTAGQGGCLGSLPNQGWRMSSPVVLVPRQGFLDRWNWRLCSALEWDCTSVSPHQQNRTGSTVSGALTRDSNQAELPTELPGQTGPPTWCEDIWAEPLAGISA